MLCFQDALWSLIINGGLQKIVGAVHTAHNIPLPAGGQFVLGQFPASEKRNITSDINCCMLSGEMSFINVWGQVLSGKTVQQVFQDCTLTHCGDVVQWADFIKNTRGAMKIRWPSNIQGKIIYIYIYDFDLLDLMSWRC